MSLKYRLTVLALVISLAAAVLILTNYDSPSAGEVETDQAAPGDNSISQEDHLAAGAEFKPADDPYQAYLDARESGNPIVLKFYARW